MEVLRAHLDRQLETDQENREAIWARAALAASHTSSPHCVRNLWLRLLVEDSANIRWPVESALWVLFISGQDESDALRRLMRKSETLRPGFRDVLERLSTDEDRRIADAATSTRNVLDGGRPPPLGESNEP